MITNTNAQNEEWTHNARLASTVVLDGEGLDDLVGIVGSVFHRSHLRTLETSSLLQERCGQITYQPAKENHKRRRLSYHFAWRPPL